MFPCLLQSERPLISSLSLSPTMLALLLLEHNHARPFSASGLCLHITAPSVIHPDCLKIASDSPTLPHTHTHTRTSNSVYTAPFCPPWHVFPSTTPGHLLSPMITPYCLSSPHQVYSAWGPQRQRPLLSHWRIDQEQFLAYNRCSINTQWRNHFEINGN